MSGGEDIQDQQVRWRLLRSPAGQVEITQDQLVKQRLQYLVQAYLLINFFFFFKYFLGDFFIFFSYYIQHCFICRPSDSTVPTDAGIEPRTVATGALAIRRSNHSARSHPHSARSHPPLSQISSATQLDLIRHSARSHPPLSQISSATQLDLIRTQLDLIRNSARSHPLINTYDQKVRQR